MKRGQTVIRLRREPSWTCIGPTDIRIIETNDGRYFVQGTKSVGISEAHLGEPGSRQRTESEVDRVIVQALLTRLGQTRIEAVPEFPDGCDGEFTELECGGFWGKASYRWWSVPPDSWRTLAGIASEIEDMAHLDDNQPIPQKEETQTIANQVPEDTARKLADPQH